MIDKILKTYGEVNTTVKHFPPEKEHLKGFSDDPDGPVNECLTRSAFKGGDCHNSDIGGFRRMTEIPEGQPRANPEKRSFDS